MAISKTVSESSLQEIYQIVKNNAEKLFPGVETEFIVMRCGGCCTIALRLPDEYQEREIHLDTRPNGDVLFSTGLGVIISITVFSGISASDEQLYRLLDKLTEGLTEIVGGEPAKKTVFD